MQKVPAATPSIHPSEAVSHIRSLIAEFFRAPVGVIECVYTPFPIICK